jgi:hypothetical protein
MNNDFFPFIHKIPNKKDQEPELLYLELDLPEYQYQEDKQKDEEKEERGVVIIQL